MVPLPVAVPPPRLRRCISTVAGIQSFANPCKTKSLPDQENDQRVAGYVFAHARETGQTWLVTIIGTIVLTISNNCSNIDRSMIFCSSPQASLLALIPCAIPGYLVVTALTFRASLIMAKGAKMHYAASCARGCATVVSLVPSRPEAPKLRGGEPWPRVSAATGAVAAL